MIYNLNPSLTAAVQATLKDWQSLNKTKKLWAHDASLWTNTDESKWLGWLEIVSEQIKQIDLLKSLSNEMSQFKYALLLGMGGSSLGPEVLDKTFGQILNHPRLLVLDSTDPAQVKTFEKKVELDKTIFIVSSKSGSTLEPNIFKQYFFNKVQEKIGSAGKQFIAITDPGSQLELVAKKDQFRHIFPGLPSIGGRYSILSNFGMVPAAIMGLDVQDFLKRSESMVKACTSDSVENNPGVLLGIIMGVLANQGKDKVTIITSPVISDLGAWLEQLIAESTGKAGKGLIPVDEEPLGDPSLYGDDRLFVYLRLENKSDSNQDKLVDQLQKIGQPVVQIALNDIKDIAQEFFRWEIAVAVAGSIIGINAFNQPDVEASKIATRNLTNEYEKTGKLPSETPFFDKDGFKLFSDSTNIERIKSGVSNQSLTDYLKAHLSSLHTNDYFALLAYLEMNDQHKITLQKIRQIIRDKKKVATCLGFGPRFLHSTGQAYKGGPDSGVFLQITCDDPVDLPIPEQKYTFGIVKAAQARGDFQVLVERKRRALRIHLTGDLNTALNKLYQTIQEAVT